MADILALKGYKRNGPFALDAKSKWDTYAEALNFVKTDAAAYPGMVIAVSGQKEAAVYEAIYDTDGTTLTLQELALKSSSISDTLKSEMYAYLNSYITSGDSSTLSESKEYTDSKIATVYKYKGSVQSYDLLPLTDNQVGDTYNVYAANGSVPAGANYAWNGAAWDSLQELSISAHTQARNQFQTKRLGQRHLKQPTRQQYHQRYPRDLQP